MSVAELLTDSRRGADVLDLPLHLVRQLVDLSLLLSTELLSLKALLLGFLETVVHLIHLLSHLAYELDLLVDHLLGSGSLFS